jgi:hypothetical protein
MMVMDRRRPDLTNAKRIGVPILDLRWQILNFLPSGAAPFDFKGAGVDVSS